MIKRWKHECNVDLTSFAIAILVVEFFRGCPWPHHNHYYHDWYVRDCLKHMRSRLNGWISVPGTGEFVSLGNSWASKVETAIGIAEKACDYEYRDLDVLAGVEWQKIFGPRISLRIL